MRRLSIAAAAAVSTIALTQIASAADLPRKAPAAVLPPAQVLNWTGWYVGGNIGYGWGTAHNDFNAVALDTGGDNICSSDGFLIAICAAANRSNALNGAIGGLQIGYNWQIGKYLAGIESDIQISGQRGDDAFTPLSVTFVPGFGTAVAAVSVQNSESLKWFGTLRGRLGVIADRWLIYGTGGLAYGHVKVEGSAAATGNADIPPDPGVCIPNGCPFLPWGAWSNSQTRVGWTAGAGLEYLIGDNHWSVKLEYLYVDLGSIDTTFGTLPICFGSGNPKGASCTSEFPGSGKISTRITDNIVRVGLNYKFN